MLSEACVPAAFAAVPSGSHRWRSDDLGRLGRSLAAAAGPLRTVEDGVLLEAWSATVTEFRDPDSAVRRALDPSLASSCRLSRQGLAAGLEAVLGGVASDHAASLFAAAGRPPEDGFVLVVLSANIPGLAVQPLLPALALRRPVLLKSSSAEPLFAPAFVASLCRRLPVLGDAVAAVSWAGGDLGVEEEVVRDATRLLVYGDQPAVDDLERRAGSRVFAYGPRCSLAVVGSDAVASTVSAGLARDIALFDQRGCLSIHGIFTDGDVRVLADAVAHDLRSLGKSLPPGIPDTAERAGLRLLREEAELRGLYLADLPEALGTVLVDPVPRPRISPGCRAVRIWPVGDLGEVPALLRDWEDRIQGVALAGRGAWVLENDLADLGATRFTQPGDLQTPNALWHNGGVHPLGALSG